MQIADVPREGYEVLGLDEPRGGIVSTVVPGGPAHEADMEPGDVIVAYAGEPVEDSGDLQSRVVATRPGTEVAVDVVRAGEAVTLDVTVGELDLESEARSATRAAAEESSAGFGMTLQDLTPRAARRLGLPADTVGAVVTDIERGSAAEAGGLQAGDVVLRVNRVDVASAAEAGAELDAIASGRTAFLLVQRRRHAAVPAGGEGVGRSRRGVMRRRLAAAPGCACRRRRRRELRNRARFRWNGTRDGRRRSEVRLTPGSARPAGYAVRAGRDSPQPRQMQ